jgi:transposase
MRDVDHGRLPVRAAAQLLGRSERQVWRLLKAFRAEGAPGLISKKRGRPSNRKTAKAVRSAVLWIVRQNYADFDKVRQVSQAAVVENKQLGAALAFIRDQQLRRGPEHLSDRAPRRRDQHNPRLFKVD